MCHRITGDRRVDSSLGASYEKAHVAVDDATQLADVEVPPDEQQAAAVGFLVRAVSLFNSQGISCCRVLSDNGSAYRSKQWRKAWSSGLESETDQGVQTPDQQQGRAVDQDVAGRVGLHDAVQQLRGAQAVATPLPVDR